MAADVFSFSSLWETFGLALVEAASQGLPLVVSDLPVSREVLGVNGSSKQHVAFVPPGDVDSFAAELEQVHQEGIQPVMDGVLAERFSIPTHTRDLLAICESRDRAIRE